MLGKHSVVIGIRGLVYRDVSSNLTSTASTRTESFGDFIKSVIINERISLPAFKELVLMLPFAFEVHCEGIQPSTMNN